MSNAKPWKSRKAWLVGPEFEVTGERYAAVRAQVLQSPSYRPDLRIVGQDAALCLAREMCIADKGKYLNAVDGGYAVRRSDSIPAYHFIVEGPDDHQTGGLPDWAFMSKRERVEVEGQKHVWELVECSDEG